MINRKSIVSWIVIILAFGILFGDLLYIADFKSRIYGDSNVSGQVYYESYQVNITILKNASLSIAERWIVNFRATKGEYHFAYRIFPASGFDDIVAFRAYELRNRSDIPLKTQVLKGMGFIALKFYFEPIRYGKREFIIRYLVHNALDTRDNRNIIRWIVFPEKHSYIKEAEFRVIIPSRILAISIQRLPSNVALNASVNRKNSNTVIYARMESLGENETVKLYCEFNKIVKSSFSIRKTLNLLLPYVKFAFFIEISCFLLYLAIKIFYRPSEELDVEKVIADLDPIEFLFLQHKDPPSTLIGLSLILYYGSKGYLRLVAEKNKLYISEVKESVFKSPWLGEPYERLVFLSKIQEPLTVDIALCRELGDYASEYRDEIDQSLTEKGYLDKSSSLFSEIMINANVILGLTIIFLDLIPLILNIGYELFILSLIPSIIYITLLVMSLNIHTDGRTPRGRGAIRSMRQYGKSLLKLKSKTSIEKNIDVVIRILRDYLPYLLGFPEFAELVIGILNNMQYLEARYQRYLAEKLTYIRTIIIATELLEPIIEPILKALASTIAEVFNAVKNDLLKTSFKSKKRISRGGFGGGGIAGFG